MNQKTERKLRSREAILASATALLRGRGIRDSSVADVMSGAGLTVGGFYGHFPSKEQLFVATIRSAAGAMWSQLLDAAQGASPRERALSVVRRYLSRAHRDHAEAGCLLPSVAPEVAREGDGYRGALEAELAGFVGSFAALLEAGPDRREQALGLIALMYGALSLSRAVRGTPLSDEVLRAGKKLAERALAATDPAPASRRPVVGRR